MLGLRHYKVWSMNRYKMSSHGITIQPCSSILDCAGFWIKSFNKNDTIIEHSELIHSISMRFDCKQEREEEEEREERRTNGVF